MQSAWILPTTHFHANLTGSVGGWKLCQSMDALTFRMHIYVFRKSEVIKLKETSNYVYCIRIVVDLDLATTVHYLLWNTYIQRGRAHRKILRKYCILPTSPHHHTQWWLNIDSASYSSLVAAASLNTRSICKLRVISAMAPQSSLAQVQSMMGGIWPTK